MDIAIAKINELIEKEKKIAIEVNPHMALGMAQVQMILNDYAKKEPKEVRLETPIGRFKAVEYKSIEYPKIDIIEVNEKGEDIGLVASVEYNKTTNSISTYAYEENADSVYEVDFINKTIYRDGGKCNEKNL